MKQDNFEESMEIPGDCSLSIDNGMFFVKGPKGETSKEMLNPKIKIIQEGKKITFYVKRSTKKEKKLVNTYKSHLKNLFKGAREGYVYKLKICSGHFPMNVSVKEDVFEIKNFLGEKVPIILKIRKNVSVKLDGTEVIVEGINKEETSQMAALIEQLTRRPGYDKRIFQDGIYIIEKAGKKVK